MDRRSFLKTIAQGLTVTAYGTPRIVSGDETKPPNIILIMTDDQGL